MLLEARDAGRQSYRIYVSAAARRVKFSSPRVRNRAGTMRRWAGPARASWPKAIRNPRSWDCSAPGAGSGVFQGLFACRRTADRRGTRLGGCLRPADRQSGHRRVFPGAIGNPYPRDFIDRGDTILMRLEEYDAVRTIHLDESTSDGFHREMGRGHVREYFRGGFGGSPSAMTFGRRTLYAERRWKPPGLPDHHHRPSHVPRAG